MVDRHLRVKRKKFRRTPGGKTAVHYTNDKREIAECAVSGKVLSGTGNQSKSVLKKRGKTNRRPSVKFGGVLGTEARRELWENYSLVISGKKKIIMEIKKIKGIGLRKVKSIGTVYEKETGKSSVEKIGKIMEEDVRKLEKIVQQPQEYGIPGWSVNRRRDFVTGTDRHLITSDLDFALRQDIQRLSEIKTYRGFRHTWGLPVRGQSTKSTHRGKGGVVGVTKKDVKAAAAPAAAAAAKPAPAKGKGK